jgi:hypothetical protein
MLGSVAQVFASIRAMSKMRTICAAWTTIV